MENFHIVFIGDGMAMKAGRWSDRIRDVCVELMMKGKRLIFWVDRYETNGRLFAFAAERLTESYPEQCCIHNRINCIPVRSPDGTVDPYSMGTFWNRNVFVTALSEAVRMENRETIDRADLLVVYIGEHAGCAARAKEYARERGKRVLDLTCESHGECW